MGVALQRGRDPREAAWFGPGAVSRLAIERPVRRWIADALSADRGPRLA